MSFNQLSLNMVFRILKTHLKQDPKKCTPKKKKPKQQYPEWLMRTIYLQINQDQPAL